MSVFDLAPRIAADVANALPAGADEDALLAFALDVEDRIECTHGDCALAEFLDLARDAVGNFVVELLERRLANELRHEEPNGSAC